MDVVVVFKPDGTIQCEGHVPIPLEHHAAELRKIGASEIFAQGNVPGPFVVITLCGTPTGRVNAFAIPREDWDMIRRGIVGTLGFRHWTGAPHPDLAIPSDCRVHGDGAIGSAGVSVASLPTLVRELLGRPGRCYQQGDPLSDDFIPNRVNIEHDENLRISDIWFG